MAYESLKAYYDEIIRLAKLQGGRSMLTERDKRKLRKIKKLYKEGKWPKKKRESKKSENGQ